MRTIREVSSLFVVCFFIVCIPAPCQQRHMQLLAPGVGWALDADRLYWTTDGGAHWGEITPSMTSTPRAIAGLGVRIAAVFFLDTSSGWVVLSRYEDSAKEWRFEIAATVDGGANWSITPLDYPDLPPTLRDAIGGPAGMCFVDSMHGWIDMAFAGNSRPGKLLSTDDGGRTWTWIGPPVVAGAIRFVTTQDGWLAGGPDSELYVTHDGGKSWKEIALTPPPQVGAATDATRFLPVFEDPEHGFAAVNYSGPEGTPPKFVVYATEDGGRTWQPRRVLAEAGEPSIGSPLALSITDSMVFVPAVSSAMTTAVVGIPLRGGFSSNVVVSSQGVLELSYADSAHGWMRRTDGKFLSTADGGSTWADIAPPHRPTARMGRGANAPVGGSTASSWLSADQAGSEAPGSGGGGSPPRAGVFPLGQARSADSVLLNSDPLSFSTRPGLADSLRARLAFMSIDKTLMKR